MKIIKIGTFDKTGNPINWHIDLTGDIDTPYCVSIIDNKVCVNNVEIVEWTEKRNEVMSQPFLDLDLDALHPDVRKLIEE